MSVLFLSFLLSRIVNLLYLRIVDGSVLSCVSNVHRLWLSVSSASRLCATVREL
jgi:hypothetical protein